MHKHIFTSQKALSERKYRFRRHGCCVLCFLKYANKKSLLKILLILTPAIKMDTEETLSQSGVQQPPPVSPPDLVLCEPTDGFEKERVEELKTCVLFVEATRMERNFMYDRYKVVRLYGIQWEFVGTTTQLMIGHIDGRADRNVFIRYGINSLNGLNVCFYQSYSIWFNIEMAYRWLAHYCGARDFCDAEHFHTRIVGWPKLENKQE